MEGALAPPSRRYVRDLTASYGKVTSLHLLTQLLGIPLDSPEVGPDVIASVVSYLVKPEAYFITGQYSWHSF